MRVLGVHWIGLKVNDRAAAREFFAGVIGLEQVRNSDSRGYTAFRLPSGQQLELFDPASPEFALHDAVVVAGFEVEDVAEFRRELEAQGVEFMTEIEGGPKSGQWCYFRGPENTLYQVCSQGTG